MNDYEIMALTTSSKLNEISNLNNISGWKTHYDINSPKIYLK